MKHFIVALTLMTSFASYAKTITSTKNNFINVARVDKVITLVEKQDIEVKVVVEDLGRSTDISPTQKVYFTLFAPGEMFSTDATFDLGNVYALLGAKRVSGGIYEVEVVSDNGKEVVRVDAVNAINNIKAVRCADEFDCAASRNFSDKIDVTISQEE